MPFDGSGFAARLTDTTAVSGTKISSEKYNRELNDVYALWNGHPPTPIARGGTGGATIEAALVNLGLLSSAQIFATYVAAGTVQTFTEPQRVIARNNIDVLSETETFQSYVATSAQVFTEGQKSIARANIGTLSNNDIFSSYITALAAQTFTAPQQAQARANIGLPDPIFFTAFSSAEQTVPASAGAVTVSHGLSAVPKIVRVVLRCAITQYGWAVGDEVDITSRPEVSIGADATNITVAGAGPGIGMTDKSGTPLQASITPSAWRVVIRAYV